MLEFVNLGSRCDKVVERSLLLRALLAVQLGMCSVLPHPLVKPPGEDDGKPDRGDRRGQTHTEEDPMSAPCRAAPRGFEFDFVGCPGPFELGARTGLYLGPSTLDHGSLHGGATALLVATPSVLGTTSALLFFDSP